jgi:tetratricopeptide (TPR) repeat protein
MSKRVAGMLLCCGLLTGCGRVDSRWPEKPTARDSMPATPQAATAFAEVMNNPRSARARYALGVQYYQLGYLRDAAEQFRRALELDPQDADALMGLWQVGASLNDTGNLVALATQASQLNPNDPRAIAALREVAATFEKAAIGHPNDPWLLLNTALSYAKLRDWDRAESYARQAAVVTPGASTPRLMLASLLLEQGFAQQAARELEKLADAFPNIAQAHEALGRARRALGQLDDALKSFLAAQHLRPEWVVPWMNAGDIYLQRGQYDLAETAFKKAHNIEPHALAPGLALVQTYTAMRQFDRAIQVGELARVDYPNHPALLNNLAYLYAQTGNKLDRAIEMAGQLVRAHPNNAVMRDTFGWALYRSRRHAEAVAELQAAVALAPSNPSAHFHLALALRALGQPAESAAALRAALEHGLTGAEKRDAEKMLAAP